MSSEPVEPGRTEEIAAKVEAAFREAREGDRTLLEALPALGAGVAPALAPYLGDPDEAIRREAVILLKEVGGAASVPLLIRALTDSSADLRERAATILYERHEPTEVAKRPDAGEALRASVREGNPSAAAVLLLAYLPGEETGRLLQEERARPADETSTLPAIATPVPKSLVALVAMSRVGAKGGRRGLLEAIGRASLEELSFLLAVLREVDAPEVLHALKGTLDDTRETGSGAPIGVEQSRRLCDDAMNAYVKRLNLKVGFPLDDARRYTEAQIDEVRQQIDRTIPQ